MAWMSRWIGQTEVAVAQSQRRCSCGNVGFNRRGWVVGFGHGQETASVQWVLTSRGQGRERDSKGGRLAKARCNRQSERQC